MRALTSFLLSLCVLTAVNMVGQTVTGSGSTGNIPVFTGSSIIGNSAITQSGSNIGIGTTAPVAPLSVYTASNTSATSASSASTLSVVNATPNGGFITNIGYTNIGVSSVLPTAGTSSKAAYYSYVANGSAANVGLYIDGVAGNYNYGVYSPIAGLPSYFNGNVGIGTTSPQYVLDVTGQIHSSTGIVFPDGTVQTTAYPVSTTGGGAIIEVQNNVAVINGGVSASGTGIKHVRTDASCTPGSGLNNYCTITVNWPGEPFPDTNYTATCTIKNVSNITGGATIASFFLRITDADKATNYMNVEFVNVNAGITQRLNGLNCIAIHD